MTNKRDVVIPLSVVRRAASWFARVQSAPADEVLHRACDAWRNQHPHHDLALQRLQAINAELSAGLGGVERPALLADVLTASARAADRRPSDRRHALKLLSMVAIGGSAAWAMRDSTSMQRLRADYVTAIGERRAFELQDGTLLQLDTDSVVDLRFTDAERLLVLAQGGLRVTAGRDSRPLRVRTRHATFEASGTLFSLRQESGPTRLDVEQGAVAVDADGVRRNIAAAEGCLVDESGIWPAVALGMKAGAWADGVIDTQEMRLGDFIDEVARYRRGHLRCDPAVADLRLSGVYRLDDTDRLLDVVQRALPVQVVYRTRWWVMVTARV